MVSLESALQQQQSIQNTVSYSSKKKSLNQKHKTDALI